MDRKHISSEDGKIKIAYKDIEQVCICLVPYALLQYLLLNELDMCKHHTAYFLDESVNQSIKNNLPTIHYQNYYPSTFFNKVFRKIKRLYQVLTRYIRYPFLKHAKIYAQDARFFSILIGSREYGLLEDGPDFLSRVFSKDSIWQKDIEKRSHSLSGKIEKAIYGVPYVYKYGNNNQCKYIYSTKEINSPYLASRNICVNSFQSLWNSSSEEKRQFILDVFNVTPEDIYIFKQKPIIYFSQPLDTDFHIDTNQYVTILEKILSQYDHSQVLFKTHPRDTFNYEKYFPNIMFYRKPVNLQLLLLLGISFKKAVTTFSTAVYDLPEEIEVDWFGPSIHPNTLEYCGKELYPPRSYNQVYLN